MNTDTTLGNDKLTLGASFALPAGRSFGDLDPQAHGARLVIRSGLGDDVLDVTLPGGAYTGRGTRGWKTNANGTIWQYVDQTGAPLSGITGLKATDRSKGQPGGLVAVTASGKSGTYAVGPSDVPLSVTVLLGDQDAASAGLCGESSYTATDCAFNRAGNTLKCLR